MGRAWPLPVMTAPLDLAAMPEPTALASIGWAEAHTVIRDVICPAGNDVILEVIGQTGKTGIDCPFGWPDAFVHLSPPTAPGTSHSSPMAWRQDGADR